MIIVLVFASVFFFIFISNPWHELMRHSITLSHNAYKISNSMDSHELVCVRIRVCIYVCVIQIESSNGLYPKTKNRCNITWHVSRDGTFQIYSPMELAQPCAGFNFFVSLDIFHLLLHFFVVSLSFVTYILEIRLHVWENRS